jgi:hypothetical protein
MKTLEFLDPRITAKLIEGHKDVLTQAAAEKESFYAAQTCPRCGGSCRKLGDYHHMYKGDEPLPDFYLECLACGEQFDPKTGIVLKGGNIGRAFVPAIPIINNKED